MRFLAAMTILFLTGCTTMTVTVGILEPTKLKQTPEWIEAEVVSRTPEAVRIVGTDGQLGTDRKAQQFFLNAEPALKAYQKALNDLGLFPTGDLTAFNFYHNKTITAYRQAAEKYSDGLYQASIAKDVKDTAARSNQFVNALNYFNDGQSILGKLRSDLHEDLNSGPAQLVLSIEAMPTKSAASPAVTTARSAIQSGTAENSQTASRVQSNLAVVVDQTDNLIGNAGILSDTHAPQVINAPDDAWQGLPNKTWGTGLLGDTDIAIKMQGVGNFTLKGVRVDASKVTQATFSSITGAVKLAAAAYGVPLPISGSTGLNTASGASTPAAPAPSSSSDAATVQSQQEQARIAAVQILQAISTQAGNAKDPNNYKTAIMQVKNVYDAFKSQLGSAAAQ